MAGYLAIDHIIMSFFSDSNETSGTKAVLTSLFDSTTFAGSAMLLLGFIYPNVLVLLGDTKPFLIIGGMAGLLYAIRALMPKRWRWPLSRSSTPAEP